MNEEIKRLEKQIDDLQARIDEIQESCNHQHIIYQCRGNSGNWDRDDSYWYEIICLDCMARYTKPQEYRYLKDRISFEIKTNLEKYQDATIEELTLLKKYSAF